MQLLRNMSDKIHDIRKAGNFYYLLNALLGAYNRRTDAWAGKSGDSDINAKLDQILEKVSGVHFPDLGFIGAKLDLVLNLLEGDGPSKINDLLTAISQLDRKVETFMATQEERLQAIATKIDEVLSDLATLRQNNPEIEDEISAIESKLSIAQPTTGDTGDTGGTTEPTPTEGGGGPA